MITIKLKNLSSFNLKYLLSLTLVAIAISGAFINVFTIFGYNCTEILLIFAYFLNSSKINHLIQSNKTYFSYFLIAITIVIFWTVFSISLADVYDSQRDMLKETRSIFWLIISFYLCKLHQANSNQNLPKIIIQASFLFPILQIIKLFFLSNSLSSIFFLETKSYISMFLLSTSFMALLKYKRKWLALLLLVLWTPATIISLYRITLLVIFTLYISWTYFFINNQFKSLKIIKYLSFSLIFIIAIFVLNDWDGFLNNLGNFLSIVFQNYPRAFNQIVYKTFYIQSSGDLLRFEMLLKAIKLPNVMPSILGESLFGDTFNQKSIISEYNVLDSGFYYLAKRLGIFWIPSFILFLNNSYKNLNLNLISITGTIVFIEIFIFAGQDLYLAYSAASLGFFLSFMTFKEKLIKEDNFKKKIN